MYLEQDVKDACKTPGVDACGAKILHRLKGREITGQRIAEIITEEKERYTLDELKRAGEETDILWDCTNENERLERIFMQARKNRVWDEHERNQGNV